MTGLKEVVFYDPSIKKIDQGAFKDCSALKSILLPESVAFVDMSAFNTANIDIIIYNPECELSSKINNSEYAGTIYGFKESTAEKYAETNGYQFSLIDDKVIAGVKNIVLTEGKTYQLKLASSDVTLASDNAKVAAVDNKGLIKAVAPGKATISAENKNGEKASVNVSVNAKPVVTTTVTTTTAVPKTTTTVSSTTTSSSSSTSKTTTTIMTSTSTTTTTAAKPTTTSSSTASKTSTSTTTTTDN